MTLQALSQYEQNDVIMTAALSAASMAVEQHMTAATLGSSACVPGLLG
jgi:hypothetical protein